MWWLLVAHFISDWALQNRWMAENKSSINEILFAHCMIYTGAISIALQYVDKLSPWKIVFVLAGHFITDGVTSRRHKAVVNDSKLVRLNFYIDHLVHFAQLLIVYFG